MIRLFQRSITSARENLPAAFMASVPYCFLNSLLSIIVCIAAVNACSSSCGTMMPVMPSMTMLRAPYSKSNVTDGLKLGNKKVVKCCLTFDRIVYEGQAGGLLEYSDTHVYGKAINEDLNEWRIKEQTLPGYIRCCDYVNRRADALLPCLYEYYKCYDCPEYHDRLHYLPLPMEIPVKSRGCRIKVEGCVRVLVGIQGKRDFVKGAGIIAALIEKVAEENPGKIEIKRVVDVPYDEYLELLNKADVLVDQLYSYTPSMNSLVAMAHGTVVVGGGEEDFYRFIGENTLRPIVNVRPEDDTHNLETLREVLLNPLKIEELKHQGMKFVRKHHDYVKVSNMYIDVYKSLLQ